MTDALVDLAHAVALGSIDDEDHHAVAELINSPDTLLRTEFQREVDRTHAALAQLTPEVAPPPRLRAALLAAIAAE
ncbi:RskA family anti-sigma factor [Nocardia camponoti]|uniref:Anti-sigma factor n=1 Tax=Nocardia camponoti TaxID=1616106 RepID=A0A917QM10_9NOCA|nr:hypothetical protein [Nocardia camponoti]GGK56897.1 hypothetical protein GCM10011591_31290 [Nocardia camponoti]